MKNNIKFSVLTPTYNREHTLNRVYQSILLQKVIDIEWIIIDDGSTDNTIILIESLKKISPFKINIISTPNGGKHRAHNIGIDVAQGFFTIILDSDDELAPEALSKIWNHWSSLNFKQKHETAGILGHCCDVNGKIVGEYYPKEIIFDNYFCLLGKKIIIGEKLPCYRTSILREYKFPERENCKNPVLEGLVWSRIGEKYKLMCINSIVRIYNRDYLDKFSLMNIQVKNFNLQWSQFEYFKFQSSLVPKYFLQCPLYSFNVIINLIRFSINTNNIGFKQINSLENIFLKLLFFIFLPLGLILVFKDNLKKYKHFL
jgi:glycosyltransferase involved in cell wall biosynthesis